MQYLQQCVNDLRSGATQVESFSPCPRQGSASDVDSEEEEVTVSISPFDTVPSKPRSLSMVSPMFVGTPDRNSINPSIHLPSPAYESIYSHRQPPKPPSNIPLPASYLSPVVYPQVQQSELSAKDHEASAALLMLVANDRRNTLTSQTSSSSSHEPRRASRGMSVRDLLRS